MRPSIQRSTEQSRVSPAAETVTVAAPSRDGSGSGTASSVSARMACSQASSDSMAATESTSRPCRCGRCTRTRWRPAALSCRNVVSRRCVTNVRRPSGNRYRPTATFATRPSRNTCARRDSMRRYLARHTSSRATMPVPVRTWIGRSRAVVALDRSFRRGSHYGTIPAANVPRTPPQAIFSYRDASTASGSTVQFPHRFDPRMYRERGVRDVVVWTGHFANWSCDDRSGELYRERSFMCLCPHAVYECPERHDLDTGYETFPGP